MYTYKYSVQINCCDQGESERIHVVWLVVACVLVHDLIAWFHYIISYILWLLHAFTSFR